MNTLSLFLFTFLFTFCNSKMLSVEEVTGTVKGLEIENNKLRAFETKWWPKANSEEDPARVLTVKGVRAEKNEDNTKGRLDAVSFIFSNLFSTQLYFAYFGVAASVPENTGSAQNDQIDVAGAAFEFFLRVFNIFEFENNDGVEGYQNTTGENADEITGWMDLSCGCLKWKPMRYDETTVEIDQEDSDNKTEVTLKYFTFETADEVFTLRFVTASHPVLIEGKRVTPDNVKIDIDINWFGNPLYTEAQQCLLFFKCSTGPSDENEHPNAQIGFSSFVAGRAGAFVAKTGIQEIEPSLKFESGAFAGYYTWETEAQSTIQGVGGVRGVYAEVVTPENQENEAVKAAVASGQYVSVLIHTFEGFRPTNISYDPEMGADIDYSALDSSVSKISFSSFIFAILVANIW